MNGHSVIIKKKSNEAHLSRKCMIFMFWWLFVLYYKHNIYQLAACFSLVKLTNPG